MLIDAVIASAELGVVTLSPCLLTAIGCCSYKDLYQLLCGVNDSIPL